LIWQKEGDIEYDTDSLEYVEGKSKYG